MDTKKVLKMVFLAKMDDGSDKSRTISLEDPKNDLTADDIRAFSDKAISASALLVGTEVATSLKEAYIEVTTKTSIIEASDPVEVVTEL